MDVVVLGEPLVEFSADRALTEADTFRLSFSGDALNAAVAAAAQQAEVALVTRVGADDFGERLIRFADRHGVDTRWMVVGEGSTGAYAVGADPSGERAFSYMRYGSAASRLSVEDVDRSPVATARVVLLSGIAAAVSPSAAAAVRHAAAVASGQVVYDPNFRARLTTAKEAAAVLRDVAPHAALIKISSPGDGAALLGVEDPHAVARACLDLGAAAVAVTRGEHGVLLVERNGIRDGGGYGEPVVIPAVPADLIVDQTGAGDNFAGVLAVWLARSESLRDCVRAGAAAASISLSGQGGTGRVATPAEIARLMG